MFSILLCFQVYFQCIFLHPPWRRTKILKLGSEMEAMFFILTSTTLDLLLAWYVWGLAKGKIHKRNNSMVGQKFIEKRTLICWFVLNIKFDDYVGMGLEVRIRSYKCCNTVLVMITKVVSSCLGST